MRDVCFCWNCFYLNIQPDFHFTYFNIFSQNHFFFLFSKLQRHLHFIVVQSTCPMGHRCNSSWTQRGNEWDGWGREQKLYSTGPVMDCVDSTVGVLVGSGCHYKIPRAGQLKWRKWISHSCGSRKSNIKVSANFSPEACLLDLLMAVSCWVLSRSFLCVCITGISSSSEKDISPNGLGLHPADPHLTLIISSSIQSPTMVILGVRASIYGSEGDIVQFITRGSSGTLVTWRVSVLWEAPLLDLSVTATRMAQHCPGWLFNSCLEYKPLIENFPILKIGTNPKLCLWLATRLWSLV